MQRAIIHNLNETENYYEFSVNRIEIGLYFPFLFRLMEIVEFWVQF